MNPIKQPSANGKSEVTNFGRTSILKPSLQSLNLAAAVTISNVLPITTTTTYASSNLMLKNAQRYIISKTNETNDTEINSKNLICDNKSKVECNTNNQYITTQSQSNIKRINLNKVKPITLVGVNSPKLRVVVTSGTKTYQTTITTAMTVPKLDSILTTSNSAGKSNAINVSISSSASNNNSKNNNNVMVTAGQTVPLPTTICNQTFLEKQQKKEVCKQIINKSDVLAEGREEEGSMNANNNVMITSPRTTLLKTSLIQPTKQGQRLKQQQQSLQETKASNNYFKSKNNDHVRKIVISQQQQQQQQQHKSLIKPQQQQYQQQIKINSEEVKNQNQLLSNINSKDAINGLQSKITITTSKTTTVTTNETISTKATTDKLPIITKLNKMGKKVITTSTTPSQPQQVSFLQPQHKNDEVHIINNNVSGDRKIDKNSLLKNSNEIKILLGNGKVEKSNEINISHKSSLLKCNINKNYTINNNVAANKQKDFVQKCQQLNSEVSLLKPLKTINVTPNTNANTNVVVNREEKSLLKICNYKAVNQSENILRNEGARENNNNNNNNNNNTNNNNNNNNVNKKQESLLKIATVTPTAVITKPTTAVTTAATTRKLKVLETKIIPSLEGSAVKVINPFYQRSQSLNSSVKTVDGERRNSEPLNNNNNINNIQYKNNQEPDKIMQKPKSVKIIKVQNCEVTSKKEDNGDRENISKDTLVQTVMPSSNSLSNTNITNKTIRKESNSILSLSKDTIETQSCNVNKNIDININSQTRDVSHYNGENDDDDVTILPIQEEIDTIEIDDDDDDDNENCNHNNDTVKNVGYGKNFSNEINMKNKNDNNTLLCEEQIFKSASSSGTSNISTGVFTTPIKVTSSLSVMATSSSPPPPTVKIEKNNFSYKNNMPSWKKNLTDIKSTGAVGSNEGSYPSVLDVLSNFNMLSWRERVGTARCTSLKFQLNEFNLVQVHERCPQRLRVHTAYEMPITERQLMRRCVNSNPNNSEEAPLLYQCRRCRSYGPAVDFLAPEFCSLHCLKRESHKRHREDTSSTKENSKKRSKKTDSLSPLLESVGPQFCWNTYLQGNKKAISAPISLFLNPYPTGPNNFKVGMKLEAIDPCNCSLFCVCTVIETNGYRLKLTFDGYDSTYDFWVNADSMDIFPPGWCCKTNHILQPPKGISFNRFNWTSYLNKERAIAAPRNLFTHLNTSSTTLRNKFKIGMHLEAEDLNDTGKLCVASVADILGDRIRIHFDGWDDRYDIIVDSNSPYIHPCGWHKGRQPLVVPPECESSAFNWAEYIQKQGRGVAACEELFECREPIGFLPEMKLEVVDPRNSSLIRPATVISHKGYRVKLHLDGWPVDHCFWLEDDSPNLHPIGWCESTGHDLEPPPGFQISEKKMPCPIMGCRGIGNARKHSISVHANRDCCPYAPENWRDVLRKPMRLSDKEIIYPPPPPPIASLPPVQENVKQMQISESEKRSFLSDMEVLEQCKIIDSIKTHRQLLPKDYVSKSLLSDSIDFPNSSTLNKNISSITTTNVATTTNTTIHSVPESITSLSTSISSGNNNKDVLLKAKEPFKMDLIDNNYNFNDDNDSNMDMRICVTKRFLCDYGPRLHQNYDLWQKNFDFDTDQIKRNPMLWSIIEVATFVECHLNCSETARVFEHECIDGTAFLMLHQNDLTDNLGLKLGPSVRLFACIMQLRTLAVTKFNVCYPLITIKK